MGYKWKDDKLMFSKRLIALCILIILNSCGETKKVDMAYKEYIYNDWVIKINLAEIYF